jgi:hypothetical protein
VSSLLKLACGQEGVVNPDGDSEMGTETGEREAVGSSICGGINRGPRYEVVEGDRATGGGLGGVRVRMGTTTSEVSARGSVWTETKV